jgi:hypothetical protein
MLEMTAAISISEALCVTSGSNIETRNLEERQMENINIEMLIMAINVKIVGYFLLSLSLLIRVS